MQQLLSLQSAKVCAGVQDNSHAAKRIANNKLVASVTSANGRYVPITPSMQHVRLCIVQASAACACWHAGRL